MSSTTQHCRSSVYYLWLVSMTVLLSCALIVIEFKTVYRYSSFNDSNSAYCKMFMSRRQDKEEMNAYCFYTVGFIIAFMGFLYVRGIFRSNHQA